MARIDPYGDDLKKEQEKIESDRDAREALREAVTKTQQEKQTMAVELANTVFKDVVLPEAQRLYADLQEATPRNAGQWEETEDCFRSGTCLYAFWTPTSGTPKFKITVQLTPEADALSVIACCEPDHNARASVLAVSPDPKSFRVADFNQAEFAEWLHARLQKCASIGLAILRP